MGRFRIGLVIAAFCLSSIPKVTSAIVHEVSSGTTGGISFGPSTQINARAGYRYLFSPTLQLGFDVEYTSLKYSTWFFTRSNAMILAGPTLNFPGHQGLIDAFYLSFTAGFSARSTETGLSQTDFAFAGSVGKRFPITANITYRPSASVEKIAGFEAQFVLVPFAFSAFFD